MNLCLKVGNTFCRIFLCNTLVIYITQWRNIGAVTLATPGAPLHGGAKLHEYLFSKIRVRLKDGRRTKIIGGITEPELTTVDGQKL